MHVAPVSFASINRLPVRCCLNTLYQTLCALLRSPLFKQAGRTDVRAAVQETLERASRQSAQVAQSLQQAAREGSRDPAEAMRRGIDGSRQATEAVTAQLQGEGIAVFTCTASHVSA